MLYLAREIKEVVVRISSRRLPEAAKLLPNRRRGTWLGTGRIAHVAYGLEDSGDLNLDALSYGRTGWHADAYHTVGCVVEILISRSDEMGQTAPS